MFTRWDPCSAAAALNSTPLFSLQKASLKTFPGTFPGRPPTIFARFVVNHWTSVLPLTLSRYGLQHPDRQLGYYATPLLSHPYHTTVIRLPAMASDNQNMSLTGTYSSPTNAPFTTTQELQAPSSGTVNPTVPDKTKYLSDLRKAVATMQDQVNKELTSRMEDDKAREAGKNGKPLVDDAEEEENYGEEVQGEEA